MSFRYNVVDIGVRSRIDFIYRRAQDCNGLTVVTYRSLVYYTVYTGRKTAYGNDVLLY